MKKIYLLLLIGVNCLFAYSQEKSVTGPGGVPGAVLWMKTVPETNNLNGRYKWQDFSGDSLRLNYYNSTDEYIVEWSYFGRSYNFHPSIRLTNPKLSKEIQILSANLSTSTLIGTFAEHNINGERFSQPDYILSMNGVQGKGYVLNKDKIINSKESGRGVLDYGLEEGYDLMYHQGDSPEPDLTAYKERTIRSFTYFRTNKPVTGVWGEKRNSHLSLGEKFYSTNLHNTSNYDTGLFDSNSVFEGYIPELFIYDRLLTPLERIKTETYLALKYGFMLETSYIGSNDQLLWDLEEQKTYNNRVTGLYRDDKSGLYQRKGSTSYEERPYFSYTKEGDSYDLANNYGLSSRNRLLVIEKFPANKNMSDTEYMIWGDNNQDLQTQPSEEFLGMNLMNRRWIMKTNAEPLIQKEDIPWNISANLDYGQEKYNFPYIKRTANSDTSPGVLSSVQALPGYEGHISFTLTQPLGQLLVKFGTKNVPEQNDSHDYGIFINEKGEVYPILRGYPQWNKKWNIKVKAGDRIRIEKNKESILISSNGDTTPQTGQSLSQILVDSADIEKDFYVSLGLYPTKSDVIIKNFRTGGFIDNGNRIELSYEAQRASEFSDYKEGKSYLLVDRSGTGKFKLEDTDLYPSDEYDVSRQKIVFNNVFFDTNANGKDIFTFGYRENNLIVNLEKEEPDCSSPRVPSNNGSVTIKIVRGDAGFEYQLLNKETSQTEKSGIFFGTDFKIDQLSAGDYTVKIKEIGGFNMISDSTKTEAKAISNQSIDWDRGGLFETTIKGTDQNFQMGLTQQSPSSGIATSTLQAGFEVQQGRIYIINNQVKSSTPLNNITLKEGDKLDIYKDYKEKTSPYKVYYRVNGETVHTQTISGYRYFMIKLNNNTGAVYHIKNTDGSSESSPLTWNYQGLHSYPQSANLFNTTVEYDITLEENCGTNPGEDPGKISQAENNVVFYYKDFSNQSEITTQIKLKNPSALTIAVFDFSGHMIYTKNVYESLKEHTLDLVGLPKGVYIVKVFTSEGEFSKKITIN